MQAGDVILAFNGHPIEQGSDLPPMVSMTAPGATVPVEIFRNGQDKTVTVTVGTMSRDPNARSSTEASAALASGADTLGLSVQSLDQSTRSQLGLKADEGVGISDVTGSIASQAGLQAGDVILMVNQKKVGSVEAYKAATAGVKRGIQCCSWCAGARPAISSHLRFPPTKTSDKTPKACFNKQAFEFAD